MSKYSSNTLMITAGAGPLPSENMDVLALSLPAIAHLEAVNRQYLVLEDFYPHENVYRDTDALAEALTAWFQRCDSICENALGLSRAFSANGFWFLHRLSDLRYIHCVIDVINHRYQEVILFSQGSIPDLPEPVVDYSSLNLSCFGHGLEHFLTFLYAGIPNLQIQQVDDSTLNHGASVAGGSLSSLLRRLPEVINRRGRQWLSHQLRSRKKKKGTVWVVQPGYDVEVLWRHYVDWQFENILERESSKANACVGKVSHELQQALKQIHDEVLELWFPRYKSWLISLFKSYLSQVVMKLPEVERSISERIQQTQPVAVLYAIGAETVLEECIARQANQSNIPVFFFKHGGVENLFLHPSILDPFLERNPVVERTQFLNSVVELTHYKDLPHVKARVYGSLSGQNYSQSRSSKKGVLYSVGPPAHYSFKEMRKTISDFQRYIFARGVVEGCALCGLPLSVKIHPGEWWIGSSFFNVLLNHLGSAAGDTHLLTGGSIERIISHYDLLVLDMVSTRVLSGALHLNIPIVVFVPSDFTVNPSHFQDLENRVYVVRDQESLLSVLALHKEGKLLTRQNAKFSDKYLGSMDREAALNQVSSFVFAEAVKKEIA